MRSTSSYAILSLALSLYAASLSNAESLRAPKAKARQLSDSNLFEVHLQNPASSHKRLPSEILRDHQERDEVAEAITLPDPITATAASVAGPSSTVAASSSSSSSTATSSLSAATVEITFTPRQPSHFIKHRRNKHGKRRLSYSLPAQVTFKRDDDDMSMLWDIPSLVVSAFESHADSEISSTSTSEPSSSHSEASPASAESQTPVSPSS